MAAIISTELFSYLTPVLIWIFIYAIVYMVLQKAEVFKSQPINAAIAFAASLLFVIVPVMRDLVREVVPWLLVMVLIVVVIFTLLMFMGYADKDIVTWMKENSFGATITVIVLVIFLIALSKVVGPAFLQYPSAAQVGLAADFKRVIFNPKTLGVVFLLAVAFYFMKSIAIPPKK